MHEIYLIFIKMMQWLYIHHMVGYNVLTLRHRLGMPGMFGVKIWLKINIIWGLYSFCIPDHHLLDNYLILVLINDTLFLAGIYAK